MRLQLNPFRVLVQAILLTTAYCQDDWTFTNPDFNSTFVKGQPALITWNSSVVLNPRFPPPFVLDLGIYTSSGTSSGTEKILNLSNDLQNNGSFSGWTPALNMSDDGGSDSIGYQLVISGTKSGDKYYWTSETFLLVDPPSEPNTSATPSSTTPTNTAGPSNPTSTSSNDASSDASRSSSGAVIGGAIGGALGGILIILLAAFFILKRRGWTGAKAEIKLSESSLDFGTPREGRHSWDRAITVLKTNST